jgi:outer membrane protein TolC
MRQLLAISFLACATPLFAQQYLTLDDCHTLALRQNKEIAASMKQTESAQYTQKSYRSLYLPNVKASVTGLYSTIDGNFNIEGGILPNIDPSTGQIMQGNTYFPGLNLDYQVGPVVTGGIEIEQPIYMGGKIRVANKISTMSIELSKMNDSLTIINTRLAVDNSYALLVKTQEMKKVATSYNNLLKELLHNVESAFKNGIKPKNDVMKVKVKYGESQLAMKKAENAIRLAKMNLCHVVGLPLTSNIEIEGIYPNVMQITTTDNIMVDARQEYKMLNKQIEIAEQQLKLQRSEALPTMGLKGMVNYSHGIELNDKLLLDDGSFSLLMNISIPLFHFGEKHNKIKAARAMVEKARLEQEYKTEQMQLQIRQTINNLEESVLECNLAKENLEQTTENLRLSQQAYDVGLEALSDLLEAQSLWQQAYQTNVEAQFKLYLSQIEYRKAIGILE